jgi:uncharacterized membrane protein
LDEPPRLIFDRHGEVGDEDKDEDARDEGPAWVPDATEQASLATALQDQLGAVAVLGVLLIVIGTVLQLSSSWPRPTVFGLVLVLLFVCLMLLAVGAASGLKTVLWAGLAVLVDLVVQVSFWPHSPPLWSTVTLQAAGAAIVILGVVVAWKASSRDPGE